MKVDFTFRSRRSNVFSMHGMVATSHPLAAQVGLDILKQGGNAADAAIATAAMLAVVEPLFTGLGGDCFALYWDNAKKQPFALNGSGRTAAGASIQELRQRGYASIPPYSGCAVNVPGAAAGWIDLLDRFGSMPLPVLLEPAISAAREGFPVTEWFGKNWLEVEKDLLRTDNCRLEDGAIFPDKYAGEVQPSGNELLLNGRAPGIGETIKLPTLAETLSDFSNNGKEYIYKGEFAQKLCKHVQKYGGWLTLEDMASHYSTWEEPIFADYRGYRLYEIPPNGQGLVAVLASKLAAEYSLGEMSEVDRLHIMIECMRLAFADAQQWVCDPAVEEIPLNELLSTSYTERRRALIQHDKALTHVKAGDLFSSSDTVYLTVVDTKGNACSFISSIFYNGGSRLVVPGTGVCLQNRACSMKLDEEHPNALEPNKRPYHTIIPALITHENELYSSFGVMGGYMQPHGHFQMLVNMVDLAFSPQHALDVPRWRLSIDGEGVGAQDAGGILLMEEGWSFKTLAELNRRGHHFVLVDGSDRDTFGGGQIIVRDPHTGVWIGGSDPRKDGCAVGY